jgi:hypothetical protein
MKDKHLFPIFRIAVLFGFVLFLLFHVPFIEPEFTIQCVDAPCIVPDMTIVEYLQSM